MLNKKKKIFRPVLSLLIAMALMLAVMPAALADEPEISMESRHMLPISVDGSKASFTLTATVTAADIAVPNEAVTWTIESGSESIISIRPVSTTSGADGKVSAVVTAEGKGEGKVFARINSNNSIASCTVTVLQKTGLSWTPAGSDTIELEGIGTTKQLSAAIAPTGTGGSYVWEADGSMSVDQNGLAKAKSAGAGTVTVTFNPSASYTEIASHEFSFSVIDTTPALTLAVDSGSTTLKKLDESCTLRMTRKNMDAADDWTYTWHPDGKDDHVKASNVSSTGCIVKPVDNGTQDVYCVAKHKTTGETVTSNKISFTVDIADPYLDVQLSHDTLSLDRTKTTASVKLYNPVDEYDDNDHIYWASDDTSVVRVTASSKRLSDGEAEATVYARGNGTTYVRAYMYTDDDGGGTKLVDRIKITVKNYKAIPQSGQDVRIIYFEVALLAAMLIAAGILYARSKREN